MRLCQCVCVAAGAAPVLHAACQSCAVGCWCRHIINYHLATNICYKALTAGISMRLWVSLWSVNDTVMLSALQQLAKLAACKQRVCIKLSSCNVTIRSVATRDPLPNAGVAFLDNICSGLCQPIEDMYKYHKNGLCRKQVKEPLPYLPAYRGHEAFNSMRV